MGGRPRVGSAETLPEESIWDIMGKNKEPSDHEEMELWQPIAKREVGPPDFVLNERLLAKMEEEELREHVSFAPVESSSLSKSVMASFPPLVAAFSHGVPPPFALQERLETRHGPSEDKSTKSLPLLPSENSHDPATLALLDGATDKLTKIKKDSEVRTSMNSADLTYHDWSGDKVSSGKQPGLMCSLAR